MVVLNETISVVRMQAIRSINLTPFIVVSFIAQFYKSKKKIYGLVANMAKQVLLFFQIYKQSTGNLPINIFFSQR